MKQTKKRIEFLCLALVMAVSFSMLALVGCKEKKPQPPVITLDRDEGEIEASFGEAYVPPTYYLLADGTDSGLSAKVQTVTDPEGAPVVVSFGRFMLQKQGKYTLVYQSEGLTEAYPSFFTEEMTWEIKLNSADKSGPRTTVNAYDVNYKVVWKGKTVPVPDFTATDPAGVDETKTVVYMQTPDGKETKIETGFYTTALAGAHKWLYKVQDTFGNKSVAEYPFTVINGPVSEVDNCIGYFDQEFGIEQITAYNASVELDADFEWKGLAGSPTGAIVMEQRADQWEIPGSPWDGLGIDGNMQIELFGPYIEQLASKYDVIYLPIHNPNDYAIAVRAWFTPGLNIPAGETMYYAYSAETYLNGNSTGNMMYSGEYTVINDVYRTTFSCGNEDVQKYSATDYFYTTELVTDDDLIAYYAGREELDAEAAAAAYAELSWQERDTLLIDYLNNDEAWGNEKVMTELKKYMHPKGTKWYIGPMFGVSQPDKDTENVKYLADLGYIGGVAAMGSYGDRTMRFVDSAEFTDAAKGIDGAVLYQAGNYTNNLHSGVAIRFDGLKYTRTDLAAKMGAEDYISFWVKKPASCAVDFSVSIGYTERTLYISNEWQEVKLYKKAMGDSFAGTDGLDYLYADTGYENENGEWIETYPNSIILRLFGGGGGGNPLRYDGIELAIAGITLNLSGDAQAERFNVTGVTAGEYDALVAGDSVRVPSFTTSYEASDSGKTVTKKEVYLAGGDVLTLMTERTVTITEAGSYSWIFRAYDGTALLSENELNFTVSAEAASFLIPNRVENWTPFCGWGGGNTGSVQAFENGNFIKYTGVLGWDSHYVGTRNLVNESYVFDYVVISVTNNCNKAAVFRVAGQNSWDFIALEQGETKSVRIHVAEIGNYQNGPNMEGHTASAISGINGLTVAFGSDIDNSDGMDESNGYTKIEFDLSYTLFRADGGEIVKPTASINVPYTAGNWVAKMGTVAVGTDRVTYDAELGWDGHYVGVNNLINSDYTFDFVEIRFTNNANKPVQFRINGKAWDWIYVETGTTVSLNIPQALIESGGFQDVSGGAVTGINGLTLHVCDENASDNFGEGSGFTSATFDISYILHTYS